MVPRDNYQSLRLRTDVPPEIRRLTRQVAAAADRDVNQSEALIAAIRYALEHVRDVAALLPQAAPGDTPEPRDDDEAGQ